jgi:hypothetical protein
MKRRTDQAPATDLTVSMLDSLLDGSLAGLAHYHLLKMQLDAIRNLPEVADRGTVGSTPG